MNIIRNIKLESLGYYICKDNNEKEIFEFIQNYFLNVKPITVEIYGNYIFYFKEEKCIYELDINNNEYSFSTYIVHLFRCKHNKDIRKILNNSLGKVILYTSYDYVLVEKKVNNI